MSDLKADESLPLLLFELPTDFCVEGIQLAAQHKSGVFMPVLELDPGALIDDYFPVFKVLIKGHPMERVK
jgi:hypothetical protein